MLVVFLTLSPVASMSRASFAGVTLAFGQAGLAGVCTSFLTFIAQRVGSDPRALFFCLFALPCVALLCCYLFRLTADRASGWAPSCSRQDVCKNSVLL